METHMILSVEPGDDGDGGGGFSAIHVNEWIRLVLGPIVGIGLSIYLSASGNWQAYEPPLITLLIFGPSIMKGFGNKNGN